MNPQLVLDLVDVAISLARTQMNSGDAKQALVAIVQKGAAAYRDHLGEWLDPALIKPEEPL